MIQDKIRIIVDAKEGTNSLKGRENVSSASLAG